MVRPSATGENEVLAMADCAINIKPTEDELVEIAVETAKHDGCPSVLSHPGKEAGYQDVLPYPD